MRAELLMRVVAAILFSLLVLGGTRVVAQSLPAVPDPKAFEPVGALSNGVQSHDATLAASAYSDDAVMLPPNGETVRGRAAIEAFWKQQFSSGFNAVTADRMACRRRAISATSGARQRSRSRPAAQPVTDVTRYVNVLKKDASGSWKIAMTIWTSSRPR
jgi:ketosteroid isomerase-like protein